MCTFCLPKSSPSNANDFDSIHSFSSCTDIQKNFVDSKPTHHQATYIPVSNALLKRKFPPNAPADKTVRSTPKQTVLRRNAPFNFSNRNSSTSIRRKRDLLNETKPLPFEEMRPLETATDMHGSIALNSMAETSESKLQPQFASAESATNNDSYPNFHVTYWMFYPYSQVSARMFHIFSSS